MYSGQSFKDLLGMDPAWLQAIGEAEQERWGHVEELLALNAELTHALLLAFIKANSKPGTRVPKQLHYKRPGEAPKKVSMGEFARLMARGG